MENVLENMEHAYEHAPEFFGNIVMLYIVRYIYKEIFCSMKRVIMNHLEL